MNYEYLDVNKTFKNFLNSSKYPKKIKNIIDLLIRIGNFSENNYIIGITIDKEVEKEYYTIHCKKLRYEGNKVNHFFDKKEKIYGYIEEESNFDKIIVIYSENLEEEEFYNYYDQNEDISSYWYMELIEDLEKEKEE